MKVCVFLFSNLCCIYAPTPGPLPITVLRATGEGGGAAEVGYAGVDFSEARSDGFSLGEDGMDWI